MGKHANAASPDDLFSRYIKSPRDKELLGLFNDVLDSDADGGPLPRPKRYGPQQEAHGLLVIGATGSGKSTLIGNMVRNHPAFLDHGLDRDRDRDPIGSVLFIDMPNPITLKSLAAVLLRETGYGSVRARVSGAELWAMARWRLKELGIRMLWLDEAQDLFRTGGVVEIREIMNTFKSLLKGPDALVLLLSGVNELEELAAMDGQIWRRLNKMRLEPLGVSNNRFILLTCNWYCKEAGLTCAVEDTTIDRLIHAGRHQFGSAIEIIIVAVQVAVQRRNPTLTISHFAEAYTKREGCLPDKNVFLARNWVSIDPEGSRGEQDQPDHGFAKTRRSR